MAAAGAAAAKGGGKKAGAAASAAAFEANLDLVLALGWAHVDAISLDCFVDELSSAPASSAAALQVCSPPPPPPTPVNPVSKRAHAVR